MQATAVTRLCLWPSSLSCGPDRRACRVSAQPVFVRGRAVITAPPQTLTCCRLRPPRTRNYAVHQTPREGVLMYGLPPYDENEPAENWPDVLERMEAAQSALAAKLCRLKGRAATGR